MKKILVLTAILVILWCNSALAGDLPTIYNVTMTTLNTEYSQTLSPNIKKMTIQCRSANDIRIAFATGKVAGSTAPFYTIKSGDVLTFDNLATDLETITLYCGCGASGKVAEICIWR